MLVLSRKKNESITIGDGIIITIVEVKGDKVRLGIEAPREVSVHRQEIYEAIQREQIKNQTKGLENKTGTSSIGSSEPPVVSYSLFPYENFYSDSCVRENYLNGGLIVTTKGFSGRMKLSELEN